ncbi:hypothetical protein AB0B45_31175 [Nonomuraea sp. NPDC049152]|uniref:hypothetical protein n=1 Tax=Nonomuraea sp. NPDC049152 TaxID=3154350 RepID=UPI0033F71A4C
MSAALWVVAIFVVTCMDLARQSRIYHLAFQQLALERSKALEAERVESERKASIAAQVKKRRKEAEERLLLTHEWRTAALAANMEELLFAAGEKRRRTVIPCREFADQSLLIEEVIDLERELLGMAVDFQITPFRHKDSDSGLACLSAECEFAKILGAVAEAEEHFLPLSIVLPNLRPDGVRFVCLPIRFKQSHSPSDYETARYVLNWLADVRQRVTGEENFDRHEILGAYKKDSIFIVEEEYVVDRALGILVDNKLIRSGWAKAHVTDACRITARGLYCVRKYEGDVMKMEDEERRIGHQIKVERSNVAFDPQGPVVQNYNEGVDTEKLLRFALAVQQGMPALGLSVEKQELVQTTIREIEEAAAEPESNPGRLKRLGNTLKEVLTEASGSLVAEALMGMWPG